MRRARTRTLPPRPPGVRRLRELRGLLLLAGAAVVVAAALLAFASRLGVPPRSLAPYVEHRSAGHAEVIADAGHWAAWLLMRLDRGQTHLESASRMRIGARVDAAADRPAATAGRQVAVSSEAEARQAVATARPGDVITFAPGTYRFDDANIDAAQAGAAGAEITVRAAQPGSVVIEQRSEEGFVVSAPYWRFENLTIKGVCAQPSHCEHAFHVVGRASHFVARNNTLVDFNAQFKVNGQALHFPDQGLIENNTITNTAARQTDTPVTPIDIVGASGWIIRANLITDFVKAGGNRISYGAFAKGAGSGTRFEGNVVLCEARLRDAPGSRVGLSLGGGGSLGEDGSGTEFCRDAGCVVEQDEGVIESNLIAFCSDDGIYVNRASNSRIIHNTLLDTGGITVRFAESSAAVEGNLVDGAIRSRDAGLLHAEDNLQTPLSWLYLGRHPQRALFRDAAALDLAWSGRPPRRQGVTEVPADLCGGSRPPRPAYGAFEDIAACIEAIPAVSRR